MPRCDHCGSEYDDGAVFCEQDGHRLVEAVTDPYVGQVIQDRFSIEARIGEGGMGTVYRARQRDVDRDVAIKVLRPEAARQEGALERFHREAKLASRLQSPHVAHIYLTGQLPDGNLFLALEYLQGQSLEALMGETGALSVPRTLHIVRQVGDAMVEAHDLGIVHRDLKPENIMLVRRGPDEDFVKILDFGIAKQLGVDAKSLTGVGLAVGTPRYISPEAALGEKVTAAADIYSLGVILYEMLAGVPPFESTSAAALLSQHANASPPLLTSRPGAEHVPPGLAAFVHRCLAKAPADRPGDGRAFLAALAAAVDTSAPAPRSRRSRRFARLRPWIGAAAFIVLGLVLGVVLSAQRSRGRFERLEARAEQAFREGHLEGPGGSIALTEMILSVRPEHAAALDLRHRTLAKLLDDSRVAEREGRLAGAIDLLALAERLRPEDAALRAHRERLEQSLHRGELPEGRGTPPDAGALQARPAEEERHVALTFAPARVIAGQPMTMAARVTGFGDAALDAAHFHVSALDRGRFRPRVLDAVRGAADTYAAAYVFAAAGRYQIGFASHVGGRHIDRSAQLTVEPARGAGPGPVPEPTPAEGGPDGGPQPTPEPAPSVPEPAPVEPAPPPPAPEPEPAPAPIPSGE